VSVDAGCEMAISVYLCVTSITIPSWTCSAVRLASSGGASARLLQSDTMIGPGRAQQHWVLHAWRDDWMCHAGLRAHMYKSKDAACPSVSRICMHTCRKKTQVFTPAFLLETRAALSARPCTQGTRRMRCGKAHTCSGSCLDTCWRSWPCPSGTRCHQGRRARHRSSDLAPSTAPSVGQRLPRLRAGRTQPILGRSSWHQSAGCTEHPRSPARSACVIDMHAMDLVTQHTPCPAEQRTLRT
jgi:hypothetical protein